MNTSEKYTLKDVPAGRSRSKAHIESIRIEHRPDDNPDLSWLGYYTDNPKSDEMSKAIDRQARGDVGSCEYRYFVPAMAGDETGNPESPEQDYRRCEDYNRGDWYMLGVIAKAEILSPGGVIQTVRSGGLWGIESDAGDYFDEVEAEQLAELRTELESLGFGERAIDRAFQDVQRPDR